MKLKIREKVSYGLGDMGNNIAYGAMGFYLVFFLTDVAGLSPLWAGYVFLIIRAWNAVFDLIIGVLSDKTETRFGRRRPYLLFGAIPLSISFALLWQVPSTGLEGKLIYYTLVGILFSTMFSLVAIPYNALLPEMSQDYDERTSISGFKMGLSFVGSLLSAMGVTLIVDTLYSGKSQYDVSYPVMGIALGLIIAVTILISFAGTKERVTVKSLATKKPFIQEFKSLLALKEYRMVLVVFIGNMVAFDVIMALYIYFMRYALEISDDISYLFMAIPLIFAVIATPMWVKITEKWGKQKTYIVSAIYFIIPLVFCLFIPAGNIPMVIIVVSLIGVGISASQTLNFAILPDVVEIDEQKNGRRREGIIYGATMFLYKVGSAVVVALVTSSMGWFGYIESSTEVLSQPASAIMGIRVLICIVPAMCLILSAIFVKKLPIGKAAFEDIKASIQ